MDCKKREPVKVVIIGTQYIETNPLSFKSVVQNLTGKDSCVSWVEESSYKIRKRRRHAKHSSGPLAATTITAKLSNNRSSFKDWDGLMCELPPAEELRWLWSDC